MTSRDAEEVSKLWKEVDNNRPFDISGTLLWEKIRKSHIISGTSNHKARIETIREIHSKYGVLVDPHTADGLEVGLNYREKNIPLICLETALPAKFSESIVEAIGVEPSRPNGYDNLEDLPQHFVEMDADAAEIKAFISSNI
ncbi:MAG: hypothetical protein HOF66_06490 [Nitrosomonadaceae bacterium]|nr:hypothetical protein [Nitrosomonadaceae bacterium]